MSKHDVDSDQEIIYDVAFSFAGEQRDYVEKVYKMLHNEYGLKIFYDNDEENQTNLWGTDLVEKFEEIYGKLSKYCIIFISKEYNEKVWTNFEKRTALSKEIKEKKEYILPARFDDTEIPGIRDTISYIDLSNKSPEEFCNIILKKLGISTTEKLENDTSDIRVNVVQTSMHSNGIGNSINTSHYIEVKVENHGKNSVFLKYPKIKLKSSNDAIHIFTDDFSNKTGDIGKLEPGDAREIYLDPEKYSKILNEFDFVIIPDKIGREFKAPKEELFVAIKSWKQFKK